MTIKPPLWADVILTLWICLIGVIYFGGYFWPNTIGIWTERVSRCYAVMLLLSMVTAACRYLERRGSREALVPGAEDGPSTGREAQP